MKNIIKDESGVAYLLLVGLGLTIIITGIAFNFISDFVDFTIAATSYSGTPLANQMDQASIDGGYFLLTLFKMILVPSLFIILYFCWSMAQKPVRNW